MDKKLVENYLFYLSYQVLTIITPVITSPIVARALGAYGNGLYNYAYAYTNYFILLGTLGTTIHGQREVAFQQDSNILSKTFWEMEILRTIFSLSSFGIYWMIFCTSSENGLLYRLLSFYIIGQIFDITWFFQGMEEFKVVVIKNAVVKFITIIGICFFVNDTDDLILYSVILVLSAVVGNLSTWLNLRKYVGRIHLSELKIFTHLPVALSLFLPQLAIKIYVVLDKTILGLLSSIEEVGYYIQSQKIVNLSITIVTAFSGVLMPRVAATFQNDNYNNIKKYFKISIKAVLILAIPMTIGFIMIADEFIPWFLGDGYYKSIFIMQILSLLCVLKGIASITGHAFLIPLKMQNKYTISVVCGAVINVLLNLLLVGSFKSYGVAAASVIAEATVTIVQVYFLSKILDFSIIIKSSSKYAVSSIIMGMIIYVIKPYCSGALILLLCIFAALLYFLVLYLLREEMIILFISKIRHKLNKINPGKEERGRSYE